MNARAAAFWDRSLQSVLSLLAFLVPLTFFLKTYDSALVKDLVLQAGTFLAVACAFLRAVELGRAECPVPRTALRNAAALGLVRAAP